MIGRALRAQACSFAGDVVLLGMVAAAFAMSFTVATSILPEVAQAPAALRDALVAPIDTVLAMGGVLLAAVYGSFRYTIDRRDGVIAQRLMLQSRWATFAARVPASAAGGAVVALAGGVAGHIALVLTMGGVPVDWSGLGSALAVGATAGVWGLGLGVVVQVHLVALFVVSLSLGGAALLAMLWGGAVWLPPFVMLEAFRFDVTAVGVLPADRLDSTVAAWATAGLMLAVLVVGGAAFLKRDAI